MPRIPLALVTGFLGSGKTTLIASLLRQPAMRGTAVIVNEMGAVGIDDAVFAQSLDERDVRLLANGCLCCAAGDDLAKTIWSLIQRPDPPSRIIIETSGLADPAPALRRIMADPRLRQATRIDALIATIDAVSGLANLDHQPVAARQCAVADRRLITKTDIAAPVDVAALTDRLRVMNPGASIEVVTNGEIAADKLFGASLVDRETGEANLDRWLSLDSYRGQVHGASVRSFLIEESAPVDWDMFSAQLGQIVARYGDKMLRLKGVVHTADPRPLVIHGVQKLFHPPAYLARWTRKPATSIVVIGEECPAPGLMAEALSLSVNKRSDAA